MEKTKIRSWRDILRDACKTPEKKKDIAMAVGHVTTRTLDRWMSGESLPRQPKMLLFAIGTDEMAAALQEAFPEAFQLKPSVVTLPITLPNEFYREVLHAYTQVVKSTRRYTIFGLVSNQMLFHLDGDLQGLVFVLVRVSPDEPHTLQFMEGAGNNVWVVRQVSQNAIEADILSHHVAEGNPFFLQQCNQAQIPACLRHTELIHSIGFFPLFRSGLSAGGILICSTQEDFFTPIRRTLIEEYSYLMGLALSDQDFEQGWR